MAGLMLSPEMQAYYGLDALGNPVPQTGATTQPAVPNPTTTSTTPTATGKGPTATGKGSTPTTMPTPGAASAAAGQGFKQDPMFNRGIQSMGVAQPFYMANVADLAQPQMAGQASYMRQMAGLGQTPMAQAPMVPAMPPAQFPPSQAPVTFGAPRPATGKFPSSGGPATGKLPQSQSPTPVAGTPTPTASGKFPTSGGGYTPSQPDTGGSYIPPDTPQPISYQQPVEAPLQESAAQQPAATIGTGSGASTQPEGPVMEKQGGGSTYGFDASDVKDAQGEMIRRAIDAAAGIGPKS